MGIMLLTDAEEISIRKAITRALAEDEAHADLTTLACIDDDIQMEAKVMVKQPAVIAALFTLPWVFHALDPCVEVEFLAREGSHVEKGEILAIIRGKARSLLSAERTALNLLQHASAVSSMTSHFVNAVKGFQCDILDTRKTLPSLRALQKYAVRIGGGKNHRSSLADRFLIKDNHLQLLEQTNEDPIRAAVERAREFKPDARIEIEVSNLRQLEKALEIEADIILLDNMPIAMMKEAVAMNQKQAYLEASGGVNLTNVYEIASTGVNGISIGALTHSAAAIDINMKFFHLRQETLNYGIHTQRAYL